MSTSNGTRESLAGPALTSGYTPRVHGGYRQWDRGRFQRRDVPDMLRDPQIQFVLSLLMGPVFSAEIEVESKDSRVAEFVAGQFRYLWDVALPRVLHDLLAWGCAGGEATLHEEDGLLVFDQVIDIDFFDRRPVPEGGKVVGVNVYNVPGAPNPVKMRRPGRWFWLSNGAGHGNPYGWPRIAGCYKPWNERTQAKGLDDSLRLYGFRHAFDGDTLYHPDGKFKLPDGSEISYAAFADELLAKRENGASVALPGMVDEVTGKRLWELVTGKPGGSPDFLINRDLRLDEKYLTGACIPPEVAKAQESGSGFAGRAIPFIAFLTGEDQLVGTVARGFDKQLVRPAVEGNFGGGVKYKIKPKSLVPKEEASETPKGKAQGTVEGDVPQQSGSPLPVQPPGQKQTPPAMLSADAPGDDADLGDPSERATLIAELLAAIFGDEAAAAFPDAPVQMAAEGRKWDALKHPKGPDGRFIHKGSAEAVHAAHATIKAALRAPKTADSARELADHLNILTVKQLHELKAAHGLKASGRTVDELRAKIAARLDVGRREEPKGEEKAAEPAGEPKRVHQPVTFAHEIGGTVRGVTVPSHLSYRGFKIVKPHEGSHVVLDGGGKKIGEYAGPRGAKDFIDKWVQSHPTEKRDAAAEPFYLPTASRRDMEAEVVGNDDLYRKFDEKKLLDGEYTDAEMRDIIQQWIEGGDETAHEPAPPPAQAPARPAAEQSTLPRSEEFGDDSGFTSTYKLPAVNAALKAAWDGEHGPAVAAALRGEHGAQAKVEVRREIQDHAHDNPGYLKTALKGVDARLGKVAAPAVAAKPDDAKPAKADREAAEEEINAERRKADKVYKALQPYLTSHGNRHDEAATHYVGQVLGMRHAGEPHPTPTMGDVRKKVERAKQDLRYTVGQFIEKAKRFGAGIPPELLADYPDLKPPTTLSADAPHVVQESDLLAES